MVLDIKIPKSPDIDEAIKEFEAKAGAD